MYGQFRLNMYRAIYLAESEKRTNEERDIDKKIAVIFNLPLKNSRDLIYHFTYFVPQDIFGP